MAEDLFLIKVSRSYSPAVARRLAEQVRRWNGRIHLAVDDGYLIVVSLESSYREAVQARPEVDLIGGVQMQARPLRRIRTTRPQ